MMGWDTVAYVYVNGVMLALSALGLESAVVSPSLDRWNKRFFTVYFALFLTSAAAFFLEIVAFFNPALVVLQSVAYCLQSVFMASFPMLVAFLLHSCGQDWRGSLLFRAVLAVSVAYFILLGIAQFTTWFYYVTPDGQLGIGSAYPLLIAPVIVVLLLLAVAVVRRWGQLSRPYRLAFLVSLFPMALTLVIHLITPVFALINFVLTASAYSMYRIIVAESVEQNLRQQRQIDSQRARIAVLQMRPHFIYNTMTSIYYLCDQDPKLAKEVTMDFTTYLRKNFTAIASDEAIPFSEELEHTRAYLSVEQAQFEDDLLVDYDTPHTRFRVPPLTLQPIVENAVKHGMDPDSGPLHIQIRTRETGSGSEVVVEDDGLGFDPAIADDPRTTLANISRRLEMMCGGELSITPREGGGTVVTVTLPSAPSELQGGDILESLAGGAVTFLDFKRC